MKEEDVLVLIKEQVSKGRLSRAVELLQGEVDAGRETYSIHCNLAALHLQRGDPAACIQSASAAIPLDPYCHIGYYNRFLARMHSQPHSAFKDIKKALSCLYVLRGFEVQSHEMLDRAVEHCPTNAKAYLLRGKLKEEAGSERAEEDYDKAVDCDPTLQATYQQRALFYRKSHRKEEFERDLASFKTFGSDTFRGINELPDSDSLNTTNLSEKIEECAKEFKQLLLATLAKQPLTPSFTDTAHGNKATPRFEEEDAAAMDKLPLNSVQSRVELDTEEMLLDSEPPSQEGTDRTLYIQKEELQFKKRPYEERQDRNFREMFENDSSGELNHEIEKIEREILKQGGALTSGRDVEEEMDVSDPSNFLSAEIEKAIEDLQKIGEVGQARSPRSAESIGSKMSELAEISLDELNQFTEIVIDIESMIDIEDSENREMSKVVISYGDITKQTSFSRYEWKESFTLPVLRDHWEVEVRTMLKGGVFTPESLLGEGTINLLQVRNSRCLLGSRDKKTAILNFRLSLM